jgi:hypothetical protein
MDVHEFLEQALPEWNDEARMQARFRAFSNTDENFESQFDFWRHALLLVAARHLNSAIIKTEEVCEKLTICNEPVGSCA